MKIDLLSFLLSGLIPRPFDEDDDDDANDDDGGDGGGQDDADSGGDQDKPLTRKDLTDLLTPITDQLAQNNNFRNQVSRKLGLGRFKNKSKETNDDDNDDGKRDGKLSDAEKRNRAQEQRMEKIERRASKGAIRSSITDALKSIEGDLAEGASRHITTAAMSGAMFDHDEGKTYYDDGETQVPIKEFVEEMAKDPLFRKPSKRKGGGGKGGDEEEVDDKATNTVLSDYTEEQLRNMPRDDFAKLRKKQQRQQNQGGGR